jgi:signal transduction histidine kinase/FixJ family two-component response regulator/HPt (histidine-containing phosphotransfer) domain-containing protein
MLLPYAASILSSLLTINFHSFEDAYALNPAMRKIPLQVKIGFLMFLAVLLLSATGYLSYLNLSSVVSLIRVDTKPDQRLLSIREISTELEKAENSIRLYTLTNDTKVLKPFYSIISNIDDKINKLREECRDDTIMLQQVDTISTLIEDNIVIWKQMLFLNPNRQVMENLEGLSEMIDSVTVNNQKQEQEKGILRRVFGRDKRIELDEQELRDNISRIEQQDQEIKEKLLAREKQLAVTGSEIKDRFYDLISKMESEVSLSIEGKASNANVLATRFYRWLAMFAISGALLAIAVVFITVRYVRKSDAYQVALAKSRDEAEKLVRMKEMFMANMSHEIRTPVTAISGFTEQLLHEPLNEKSLGTLRVIKSSSDHLVAIINDILDFSKLQDGKMVLEQVHFRIKKIIEDVYVLFERDAVKNRTELRYFLDPACPDVLVGDPYRLKQILINLVSNSVKFTKDGTILYSVKCISGDQDKTDLLIEVTDTGIGIDESKLKYIFEDFTQAEMSTTRRYGGTGLGLSIVRKLVDLHNGTVECKSSRNQGTRITCIIPVKKGDEKNLVKDTETPLKIPSAIAGLKVLVVDDEEYNRLLFKTILERWGVECHVAVNGVEAIEMVKTGRFDLLFMDIRMPGIDGLKVTHFIRNELGISEKEMPVICITAASEEDMRAKYTETGMNEFLSKPFTEEKLLKVIISALGGKPVSEKETKNIPKTDHSAGKEKIDLKNLYHISGGDEQFVKQMLVTFIETTGGGLAEIREAFLSGHWQTLADLSHKLLPPCRHLGALELSRLLSDIEHKAGNRTDIGNLEGLIQRAEAEFGNISSLISGHIKKIS